jgi:very-short-patch-repair endonuclease
MGIIKKVIEKNMFFGAKAELFTLALQMRKNPTEAERAMWKILRKFRKSGFPFRRQHPIEFYIADFYCHKLRLVIEVDGEIHT